MGRVLLKLFSGFDPSRYLTFDGAFPIGLVIPRQPDWLRDLSNRTSSVALELP